LGNSQGNFQLHRFTTSENIAKSFLRGVGATFLTHTVDLTPSDYYLLRNLKYRLRENQFADDESLVAVAEAWF